MIRLGIDLGGSKIEIVALAADGQERFRRRVPTPQEGYAPVLDAIAALVAAADAAVGERGSIGIGTPGSVSRATGLLRGSNSICLNGQAIGPDLERCLGRKIRITNDANCFALSEATDGAGAGAETVFGVILGTGVGAGIVVRGRVLIGPNAIAGEWGHNPMPWPEPDERPGPACFCGLSGCIEMFLSGPGLEREHLLGTGTSLGAREIAARAAAGDSSCEASLQHYERRLARALAHVINILDPDVVVLGGGLSNMSRLYDRVPRLWGDWVFSDRVDTRLVAHRHGDSSGVRGAAWLWDETGHDGEG
ncbi:MAG TPA: ROK family protein [Casimicrobiaceae bacterium]|jgi:fructokinase